MDSYTTHLTASQSAALHKHLGFVMHGTLTASDTESVFSAIEDSFSYDECPTELKELHEDLVSQKFSQVCSPPLIIH